MRLEEGKDFGERVWATSGSGELGEMEMTF